MGERLPKFWKLRKSLPLILWWDEVLRFVLDFNLRAFAWHLLGVNIFLLTLRICSGFQQASPNHLRSGFISTKFQRTFPSFLLCFSLTQDNSHMRSAAQERLKSPSRSEASPLSGGRFICINFGNKKVISVKTKVFLSISNRRNQ